MIKGYLPAALFACGVINSYLAALLLVVNLNNAKQIT